MKVAEICTRELVMAELAPQPPRPISVPAYSYV